MPFLEGSSPDSHRESLPVAQQYIDRVATLFAEQITGIALFLGVHTGAVLDETLTRRERAAALVRPFAERGDFSDLKQALRTVIGSAGWYETDEALLEHAPSREVIPEPDTAEKSELTQEEQSYVDRLHHLDIDRLMEIALRCNADTSYLPERSTPTAVYTEALVRYLAAKGDLSNIDSVLKRMNIG